MPEELNFMIGGEAGQGVQSVGFLLAKTLVRGNYYVFADQDYESRIRGGHSFFRIRTSNSPVRACAEPVDILVALNNESVSLHQKELSTNGVTVYDQEKTKDVVGASLGIPLIKLAEENAGNRLMANTVALGAALGIIGYQIEILNQVLRDFFRNEEVAQANVKAAKAGYDYARENFKGDFTLHRMTPPLSTAKKMLISGNEAIALGAIAAGCKFMAAYPMTPTTPIMEYLASKAKDFDLVVVQAEDEIAAMTMALGASFAGVRAMTATSGSGFCLMVEGLTLAGNTETPVVIVEGQRPGPATGLPTRTEQGDLNFVLNAGHGEFPRAILAPATFEDTFWLTIKAFHLADKYQIPVFVLTDHYQSTSYGTIEPFDFSNIAIDRGLLYSEDGQNPAEYQRHKITDSGISARAFPGLTRALVVTDADEHDETGHLTEDATIRSEMVKKRLRKLVNLKGEISPPRRVGPEHADITLYGWGSTFYALEEAVNTLHRRGVSINLIHLSEIWPFPTESVMDGIRFSRYHYVVENNATGQLSNLIRAQTGVKIDNNILKFDGRPFTPAHIIEEVEKEGCC